MEIYGYVHLSIGTCGDQSSVLSPLELEVLGVVSARHGSWELNFIPHRELEYH